MKQFKHKETDKWICEYINATDMPTCGKECEHNIPHDMKWDCRFECYYRNARCVQCEELM